MDLPSPDNSHKKPFLPAAEIDETRKIVVDWFGEDKRGIAKAFAEITSTSEPKHSPFKTTPIKVDTDNEIVRNWFENEPEKLVQYYKAQAEPILQKLSSATDNAEVNNVHLPESSPEIQLISNNQQTPILVRFTDDFSGMHESQAYSTGLWGGYGNGWIDYAGEDGYDAAIGYKDSTKSLIKQLEGEPF